MRGKAFVGFGFGPIQTGLMLLEAIDSGNFDTLTIAEIDQDLVEAVRGNGDSVRVNVAGKSGIRVKSLAGIRIYNPRNAGDRRALVSAIGKADELATAVPSIALYSSGGEASIAALIAEGAGPDRKRILYAAENHNSAAEILRGEVLARAPAVRFESFQFLNTVIGKMSGVISSPQEIERLGLVPLVSGFKRCVLVEEFNRILISRITLPDFARGIRAFDEKEDLLPFEEAKLYGHNAIHALLGYLARLQGLQAMSEIRQHPRLLALGRTAFINESGPALIAKHRHIGDPLFTEEGFSAYAEDLLERMTNPWLADRVERIVRDPLRKLGYGDRFFGAMREALSHGIEPRILARGAAAAVLCAMHREPGPGSAAASADPGSAVASADPGLEAASADPGLARGLLESIWAGEPADRHRKDCIRLVQEALDTLRTPG